MKLIISQHFLASLLSALNVIRCSGGVGKNGGYAESWSEEDYEDEDESEEDEDETEDIQFSDEPLSTREVDYLKSLTANNLDVYNVVATKSQPSEASTPAYDGLNPYFLSDSASSPPGSLSRVHLHRGALKDSTLAGIDARIEQVTGFPAQHFSDFIIEKHGKGDYLSPHYDGVADEEDGKSPPTEAELFQAGPLEVTASMLIFLTDYVPGGGGELIFPAADPPIMIRPKRGMAVVWHNTDEAGRLDPFSVHGEMKVTVKNGGPKYIAKKWVYARPRSFTRRYLLPALLLVNGGRAPAFLSSLSVWCISVAGDKGHELFDFLICAVVILVILGILQLCGALGKNRFAFKNDISETVKRKQTKKQR